MWRFGLLGLIGGGGGGGGPLGFFLPLSMHRVFTSRKEQKNKPRVRVIGFGVYLPSRTRTCFPALNLLLIGDHPVTRD